LRIKAISRAGGVRIRAISRAGGVRIRAIDISGKWRIRPHGGGKVEIAGVDAALECCATLTDRGAEGQIGRISGE